MKHDIFEKDINIPCHLTGDIHQPGKWFLSTLNGLLYNIF